MAGVNLGVFDLARLRVSSAVAAVAPPFNPADLSTIAWVDASQQTGINNTGQMVLQDNATATRNYTLSGGIVPITFRSALRNGRNVLQGAGGNDTYDANTFGSIAPSSPFLLWAVVQPNSDSEVFGDDVTGTIQFRVHYSGNSILVYLPTGFASSSSINWANWTIVFAVRNALNQVRLYANGVLVSTPTTLTDGFSVRRFLRLYNLPYDGFYGEAGASTLDLTTAQLNEFGQALGVKWDIPWTNIP